MSVAETKKGVEQKMQRSIEAFKNDLAKIRTGRAHTGLLDHVQVDYYGSMVPISQVANLTLVDARTIGVQPWEKNMVAKVEKAIREADLGLNPATSGDLIRVPMPLRFVFVPATRTRSQWLPFALPSLRNRYAGPLLVVTMTSGAPSPLKSAKAAPRATIGRANSAPTFALTSSKRPLPRL